MQGRIFMAVVFLLYAASVAIAGVPGDGERLAETCSGCHGTKGASPGNYIPVIGGQHAGYLKKSLVEYRDGLRPGGVMANLAKGYSDGQIDDISKAVASWKWKNSPIKSAFKGKKLAVETESCVACHGKKGEGSADTPRITGQAPGYLKVVLQEFSDGKRKSPEMELIKGMAATELDKLVIFYTRK